MIIPNNYSNTKLNKYYDVDNTRLLELVGLLEEFLSVNLFKIGYDRKIENSLLQQIENKDSVIVIRIRDFQNNKKILCLIKPLSEEEIEIALHIALENSFNHNLSGSKINLVQEYLMSLSHME